MAGAQNTAEGEHEPSFLLAICEGGLLGPWEKRCMCDHWTSLTGGCESLTQENAQHAKPQGEGGVQ